MIFKNMLEKKTLWKLNKLPLTEQFGAYDKKFDGIDQELIIEKKTGIVSLKRKLSAKLLYSKKTYNYTTSTGSKKKDINKFINFIRSRIDKKNINKIIDIGGNDLTIIKRFNGHNTKLYVIDPVGSKSKNFKNITLIKKKVENVNFKKIFKYSNLIILRHTLEHIANPTTLLKKIFSNITYNAFIVIEVPNLDLMLKNKRLDAIIHQHYHYFDKTTLSNLIISSGGQVKFFQNYNEGPCGGSMMLICKKSKSNSKKIKKLNLREKIYKIKKSINEFKIKMEKIKLELEKNKKIYGFGAGLMLPTFVYHLGINAKIFECILDDNPKKNNFSYKNLDVKVRSTNKFLPKPNSRYLITSLENVKQIKKRIKKLKPNKIYTI